MISHGMLPYLPSNCTKFLVITKKKLSSESLHFLMLFFFFFLQNFANSKSRHGHGNVMEKVAFAYNFEYARE